ncbi:MAG: hypothetical protein V4717_00210 [Bacteroidota bacterium]
MKAGKKNKKESESITGKLEFKRFGEGSKSEHDALGIETKEGWIKLKRMGGNPFHDAELEKLIGKKIKATGTKDDYQFIASKVEQIE